MLLLPCRTSCKNFSNSESESLIFPADKHCDGRGLGVVAVCCQLVNIVPTSMAESDIQENVSKSDDEGEKDVQDNEGSEEAVHDNQSEDVIHEKEGEAEKHKKSAPSALETELKREERLKRLQELKRRRVRRRSS